MLEPSSADVLEAAAVAGITVAGEVVCPERVHFAAANSGRAGYGQPDKLDRYLDPDHERALASQADADTRWPAARRRVRRVGGRCRAGRRRAPAR